MKLSLGTVQLGLAYGINNTTGVLSDEQAEALLEAAWRAGFTMLDTSSEYGLAEERIGRFLHSHPDAFEICAKYNASYPKETIEKLQAQSITRMGKIDYRVYYCVDFDVTKLEAGTAEGVSVYRAEEAEAIADNFKMVQVPASILDGRMDEEIKKLQAKGKTVLIRSVMLQGLLAADYREGPKGNVGNGEFIRKAMGYVYTLQAIGAEYGMTLPEMAVRWVWEIRPDVAIVGCETAAQAIDVGKFWRRGPMPKDVVRRVKYIRAKVPEIVISPRMWEQTYDFTVAKVEPV